MSVVLLEDVIQHLDRALEIHRFRDYGPNGLQVEGRREVRTVVTGVSAHLALFEAAAARDADLIVVHHGLIWGAGLERVTGVAARRLAALLSRGVSLAAYHLPLDVHPILGNNAGLADALGLGAARTPFGLVRGHELGLLAELPTPFPRHEVVARVASGVLGGAAPAHVFLHGPAEVRHVGLCTGAGGDLLEAAATAGCELFVTGELSERAGELAREVGVTLVAAGHHRTEVFGPARLARELKTAFAGLRAEFIDVPSPL